MASVKNLKRDINHTLGDIIGECYEWKVLNPKGDATKTEEIIDEAVAVFDELIEKVHDKNVTNKKAHFKAISATLKSNSASLLEKLNNI